MSSLTQLCEHRRHRKSPTSAVCPQGLVRSSLRLVLGFQDHRHNGTIGSKNSLTFHISACTQGVSKGVQGSSLVLRIPVKLHCTPTLSHHVHPHSHIMYTYTLTSCFLHEHLDLTSCFLHCTPRSHIMYTSISHHVSCMNTLTSIIGMLLNVGLILAKIILQLLTRKLTGQYLWRRDWATINQKKKLGLF